MVWTKELFEREAKVQVADEDWTNFAKILQGQKKGSQTWGTVVALAKRTNQLKARVGELEAQVEQQQSWGDRKQFLVLSASAVAKDSALRNEFRKKQVGKDPCRGGFVAHQYYLDFVLAAREFDDHEMTEKDDVVGAVEALGAILTGAGRPAHSMLNAGYADEEGPQSAIAAELFRLAIDWLQKKDIYARDRLRVTHQQHLVTDIESSSDDFGFIRKKRKHPTGSAATTAGDDKKADDRIDICVWFIHEKDELGACVAAAGEYKPDGKDKEAREAQADMYGSNILVLHQKPCVVIDIAGGNDLSSWKVSAYGLVPADFNYQHHAWDKTLLYSGTGAVAIVLVAWGLVNAKKSFPGELKSYGERLGPVVGLLGEQVFKVYEDAKVRKPNIAIVRDLLDKDAVLLSSKDEKLQIIRMKKFDNNWKERVSSTVFCSIINKLSRLHQEHGPHGDIRLANLLSTGHIIDFDFVGIDSYPPTLQPITQDGARHHEVMQMIGAVRRGAVAKLKPDIEHDWYSLGKVMSLFRPVKENMRKRWSEICTRVSSAFMLGDLLKTIEDFEIVLEDDSIPLQGTGHTPARRQVTNRKQAHKSKRTQK